MAQVNPYRNRAAIRSADEFYGRRQEIEDLLGGLAASTPVSVVGGPGAGKSSLLLHLARPQVHGQLGDPCPFVFVYLPCGDLRDGEAGFCAALGEGLRQVALDRFGVAGCQSLTDLERTLHTLDYRGLRLVLLLDDFDASLGSPALGTAFYEALQALATRYGVVYVSASRRPLVPSGRAAGADLAAFVELFTQIDLGPMSDDEIRQLILEPAAAAGLPLAPHEPLIRDLGGGLPLYVQIAASAATDCLAAGHGPDPAGIQAAFLEEAAAPLEDLLRSLDDDERAALGAAARGLPAEGEAAQRLELHGYLVRRPGGLRPFSTALHALLGDSAPGGPSAGSGTAALEALQVLEDPDIAEALKALEAPETADVPDAAQAPSAPGHPPAAVGGLPAAQEQPGAPGGPPVTRMPPVPPGPTAATWGRSRRLLAAAAAVVVVAGLASWLLPASPPPLEAVVLSPARVRSYDLSVEAQVDDEGVLPVAVNAQRAVSSGDRWLHPGDRLRLVIGAGQAIQVYAFTISPDGHLGWFPVHASRPRPVEPGGVELLPAEDEWYVVEPGAQGRWQLVVVAAEARLGDLEDLLLRYRLADEARRAPLGRSLVAQIHSRGAVTVTYSVSP